MTVKSEDLMLIVHTLDDNDQVLLVEAQEAVQQSSKVMEELVIRLTKRLMKLQNENSMLKQLLSVQPKINDSVHDNG